jgi:hypothetical protein
MTIDLSKMELQNLTKEKMQALRKTDVTGAVAFRVLKI